MAEGSAISELKSALLEGAVAIWRRKRLALAVCWGVCLAGWLALMLLPRQYKSQARVYVDVNGLLTPLLKGMVVDTVPSQSEEYLRQTLLTRPNLEEVIVLANLDDGNLGQAGKAALIDRLMKSSSVTEENKNLVKISFVGPSAATAKNVVVALLTIFAEAASSSSRVEMEKAQKFLDGQITQYATQLRDSEERVAAFQRQYGEYLPDSTSGAPRLQVIEQQVAQSQQDYDKALVTRNALAAELSTVPRLLSIDTQPIAGPDGRLIAASPDIRLSEAKRVLAELRLQYTDDYPDVQAAKRDVGELQAQVAAGGGDDSKSQISNPVYEQIRLKLVDAQTVLPTTKQLLDDSKVELARIQAMATQIPGIVAKSKDLDRDYAVIKTSYDELVKRRESAGLSQAADDQADRTQFRVVDPPIVPESPSFPNFPLMSSLVFLLAIFAGGGVPLLISYLRPTFPSMARLRELGLPVIGHVTIVRHNSGTAMLVDRQGIIVGGLAALIVLYGSLLAAGLRLHW